MAKINTLSPSRQLVHEIKYWRIRKKLLEQRISRQKNLSHLGIIAELAQKARIKWFRTVLKRSTSELHRLAQILERKKRKSKKSRLSRDLGRRAADNSV